MGTTFGTRDKQPLSAAWQGYLVVLPVAGLVIGYCVVFIPVLEAWLLRKPYAGYESYSLKPVPHPKNAVNLA